MGETRQKAISMMIIGYLLFTILDACGKYLGTQSIPITQIVWLRFLVQFCVAAGFILYHRRSFKVENIKIQMMRSTFLTGATLFNFTALMGMQLAEVNAVAFSAPMIIAILSIPILGERIGPKRWAAIIFGFCGVLLVLRPGSGLFGTYGIFAILFVLCLCFYQIFTRLQVKAASADLQFFYAAVVGSVGFMPMAMIQWVWPEDIMIWVVILIMGTTATIGHALLIKAHEMAPAPILAPFIYVQMLFMISIGWLWFDDIPTLSVLMGAAIIILASAYMWYRERQIAQQ